MKIDLDTLILASFTIVVALFYLIRLISWIKEVKKVGFKASLGLEKANTE